MTKKKAAKKARKASAKSVKTSTGKGLASTKSSRQKKSLKGSSARSAKAGKASRKAVKKAASKVPSRKTKSWPTVFASAVKVYEAGLKLLHREKFDQAKAKFDELIIQYPTETGLLDRANLLIRACEHRIRQKSEKVPKLNTADDYYEIGVAELNRRKFDSAKEHFEHAMKLAPKADHVHYALAATSALEGQHEAALEYLEKAIQYRDENRFLAVNDPDFESLSEDSEFVQLVAVAED